MSKQKLKARHNNDIKVTDIVKESQNFLKVKWCDGHEGIVPRTARGYYGPPAVVDVIDKYYKLSLRHHSAIEVWDHPDDNIYKFWNYEDLLASDEAVREYIAHFMKYGLVFLRNCDTSSTPEKLMEDLNMTPLLATIFGPQDPVIHKSKANNHAYSARALAQHMDLTFYEPAPNIFGLMCVENESVGGMATLL